MRGYYVKAHQDCDYGLAIVADNAREAKTVGFYALGELGDLEYTDVRVKWQRDSDVSGLVPGVVNDEFDALKRGLYGCLMYSTCPSCGAEMTDVEHDGHRFFCDACRHAAETEDAQPNLVGHREDRKE